MRSFLLVFLAALLLAAPAALAAEDPMIDDVVLEKDSPLNLSFKVKNAFTPDIEEAIRSGIPTSFTFLVEVHRTRGLWFDKETGSWRFRHTVKFDTLKEEYEIILEEGGGASIRTKDPVEMKRLMTEVTRALVPERALESGRGYSLRIKAELHTIRLPFLLDYVLFFIKFWDFETDWHTQSFTW